jgi:hypothetical protein
MPNYQLEIHHIDVTGGDCTFIVVRNLDEINKPVIFSMLVDTGGVGSGPKKMLKYLQDLFPEILTINFFIASHYHDDHIRGVGYKSKDGVRLLKFDKVLDIGDHNNFCYPAGRTTFDENSRRKPGYIKNYYEFTRTFSTEKKSRLVPAFMNADSYKEGSTTKLGPFEITISDGNTFTGYTIKIWSAKGVLANGTDVIGEQKNHTNTKIDANDLSIAFTIGHTNGLSYFSAGDLSGDPTLQHYVNVEGALLNYLKTSFPAGVKIVKSTHHGSERNNHGQSSTSIGKSKTNFTPGFFDTLKPKVLIVPCNQAKQVPAVEFLRNRLVPYMTKNTGVKTYFLNKVDYKKTSMQGPELQKLIALNNTNLKYLTDENIYAIDRPTAAIIVVHQENSNFNQPFTEDCTELTTNEKCRVYKFTRDIGIATAYGTGGSSVIYNAIAESMRLKIFSGFEKYAKRIGEWILEGFTNGATDNVRDFLDELYPSLYDPDGFPTAADGIPNYCETLKAKSEALFYALYTWGSYWGFNFKGEHTEDDETTMLNLLVGNIDQLDFNFSVSERRYSWNTCYGKLDLRTPFPPRRIEVGVDVLLRIQTLLGKKFKALPEELKNKIQKSKNKTTGRFKKL